MRKLAGKSYKIVKILHIVSASVWIGASVVGLFMLTVVLNANNAKEILLTVHSVDLLIIVPANLLTFVTGIIFSSFTDWRFFKHGWITLKYVINLIPIVGGGFVFARSIITMLAIVEEKGGSALSDPSFALWYNIFTGTFVVMLVLLTTAVYLSVMKPKSRKRRGEGKVAK